MTCSACCFKKAALKHFEYLAVAGFGRTYFKLGLGEENK